MRYSANLNIIIKAIEKATARTIRDFSELEILQTNPVSANKFANACYKQIKEILIEDLFKFRPDYNIIFADGEKIIRQENAEYFFTIFPIDGMNSLSRGIPDFTVAIALSHIAKDGSNEPISVAVHKIVGNELYYCEKGFGAYLNKHRIRVSKRNNSEVLLLAIDDYANLTPEVKESLKLKSFVIRSYGCRTLETAYLAAARFDLGIFKNTNQYLKPFLLLIKEAGGKIIESDKLIISTNNLTNSQ